QGVHQHTLFNSMTEADAIFLYQPDDIHWNMREMVSENSPETIIENQLDKLVEYIVEQAQPHDHLLVMSNGGFGGIHQKLLDALALKELV
ncbi:MAG: UDP-N-acetylmuramate:L-alanyl-gamma-D-glutamyl-meso-diaminopimelate ligase, partial [Psychrobium sp.]